LFGLVLLASCSLVCNLIVMTLILSHEAKFSHRAALYVDDLVVFLKRQDHDLRRAMACSLELCILPWHVAYSRIEHGGREAMQE